MIENNIISDHFTVEELKKLKITPPDAKMYKKIRSNWDSVAKPLDGMGWLLRASASPDRR